MSEMKFYFAEVPPVIHHHPQPNDPVQVELLELLWKILVQMCPRGLAIIVLLSIAAI